MNWTPGDYLLRNAFCPPSEIQALLDDVRSAEGAGWFWLLSYSSTGFIRSLSFCASESSSSSPPNFEVFETVGAFDRRTLFNDIPKMQEILTQRLRLAVGHVEPASRLRLVDGTVSYWLVSSEPISDGVVSESMPKLAEMLGGTLVANSVRDGRISELILNAAEDADVESRDSTISSLLTLGMTVSGADGAAFYQFAAMQNGLIAERECGDGRAQFGLPELINLAPHADDSDLSRSVRNSFRRSRTLLQDGVTASGVLFQAASIPAPLSPLSGIGRNAGVLVVWKRADPGSISMSWFDVAVLRNVALRISLLISNDRLETSARELGAVLLRVMNLSQDKVSGELGSGGASRDIPADIFAAREVLEELANRLWIVTKCDSVTIRVLLTDFNRPRHLRLRQLVVVPKDRLEPSLFDLDVAVLDDVDEHYSLNSTEAHAAVVGLAHIRDSAAGLGTQVPDMTRIFTVGSTPPKSEISVPILVDGMVIGTLSLESSYANSFLPQVQLISAFATVAGLAVAMRRRETLRALAERYALASEGFHEVSKLALVLEELPVDLLPNELREVLAEVETPDHFVEVGTESLSLRQLLGEQAQVADLVDMAVSGSLNLIVRSKSVPILRDVFKELFKNARTHSVPGFPTFVSGGLVSLVSGTYLLLVCRSKPKLPIFNEKLLRSFYRTPQQDPDGGTRLHLGCFTVGEQVRSLKGNVFAGRTAEGLFETHLFIPKEVFE